MNIKINVIADNESVLTITESQFIGKHCKDIITVLEHIHTSDDIDVDSVEVTLQDEGLYQKYKLFANKLEQEEQYHHKADEYIETVRRLL